MGPQVQPKCFRHVKHMRNNWELRKQGYLIRFGHTEALLFKKKKDIKRPFFPPCRNWPIWLPMILCDGHFHLKRAVERLKAKVVDGELSCEVDEARTWSRLASRVGEVGEGGGSGDEEEDEQQHLLVQPRTMQRISQGVFAWQVT